MSYLKRLGYVIGWLLAPLWLPCLMVIYVAICGVMGASEMLWWLATGEKLGLV